MSSLRDFIFEQSGSLKVSVAWASEILLKVQTSDGYGYDVVTPFSVTNTVRNVASTGAGSSSTTQGSPWRMAERPAASAADSWSFEVARKNGSSQRFGFESWKHAVSVGSHSAPPAWHRRWKSPAAPICRSVFSAEEPNTSPNPMTMVFTL